MKNLNAYILLSCIGICLTACDEELAPPEFNTLTTQERLLINDWTYSYILMGSDTIRALTFQGEPRTEGILEAVDILYRRYDRNHSYQYRWDEGDFNQRVYGSGDNFQPNFGYWHLASDGNTLIHNETQTYEKQFEILELTESSLRLKLVGDRISYLTNNEGEVTDTITASWIEVFIARE